MTSTARYKCIGCGNVFDGDAIRAFERHVEQCLAGRAKCIECGMPMPKDAGPLVIRHAECCWVSKPQPPREWISVSALSWLAMSSCLLIGPSIAIFPPRSWVTISLMIILLLSIIGFIVKGIGRKL